MTWYLLDVAIWQGSLRVDDVTSAGFHAVNLKVSHGVSLKNVHPDVAGWVTRARAAGLNVCAFHYLTADAPGAAQAEYAYARLQALGLTGAGHTVDVEAPGLTAAIIGDYVRTMTTLLLRKIRIYSADWRWEPGWLGVELSPHLWAAPNDRYLPGYPGDTSPHWRAGYGGWTDLSVMQYSVGPLTFPDGSTGSIKVSKSAIRDPQVWAALTGGEGMTFAPPRLLDARGYIRSKLPEIPVNALGIVGGGSHVTEGTGYHIGKSALKSTAYSIVESSRDRNGLSEAASALDFGWWQRTINGKIHNLRTFSVWLVAQCKAGTADTADIREVIYSPDGKTVKRWDRLGRRTTGDTSHLEHTHLSYFRDSEGRDKAGLFRRYFTEIGLEDDMPLNNDDIERVSRRTRDLILYETRFPWSSEDYQGNGYQRNVEDFYKDMWTALYRSGNGGGPGLPEQSPFTTIITLLRAVAARDVDADKIADAVVAKLPADRDDVTVPELAEAIRQAVHNPTGQA